nr:MAG TPA: hypothetical protein [Caudoviricetes sp.]
MFLTVDSGSGIYSLNLKHLPAYQDAVLGTASSRAAITIVVSVYLFFCLVR